MSTEDGSCVLGEGSRRTNMNEHRNCEQEYARLPWFDG